jgi:hypothetical protein
MDTKRTPRCSIRVQVSETRVASEKSGREMMISKRKILCLALLASTAACSGGGGGGGGGGGASSTTGGGGSTGTTTTPPAVGSTKFSNPSVVMTNNGTATMSSNATSQSVAMLDGEVADPNSPGGFDHKDLIVVNVNDGGVTFVGNGNSAFCKPGTCGTTGHVFDITNDVNGNPNADSAPGTLVNNVPIGFTGNGRPTAATANFPNDPTFQTATETGTTNTVTFDSSLSFSLFGIWEGKDDKTGLPVVGAFAAAGEGAAAAPFSTLPTTGSATYDGNAIAVAASGGNITHLDGVSTFTANFLTMSLSGTVNLNNAATGTPFTTLNFAPGQIVAGVNGQAVVGNAVASSDRTLTGTGQGLFVGAANQTSVTTPPEFVTAFTVSGGGTTVSGAAGGKLTTH